MNSIDGIRKKRILKFATAGKTAVLVSTRYVFTVRVNQQVLGTILL